MQILAANFDACFVTASFGRKHLKRIPVMQRATTAMTIRLFAAGQPAHSRQKFRGARGNPASSGIPICRLAGTAGRADQPAT